MPTIVPKKFVSQPVSGLDVIQEAQAILKRISFGPDEPAYEQGESVSVFVDPERIPGTDQFSVFVTLYAHGHRNIDWPRCLLAVVPEGLDETILYLEPLNISRAGGYGGSARRELPTLAQRCGREREREREKKEEEPRKSLAEVFTCSGGNGDTGVCGVFHLART